MTPTTRAGQRLLRIHEACDPGDKDCTVLGDLADVVIIEAEARQQERERLAGLVVASLDDKHCHGPRCADPFEMCPFLSILRETEA